MTPGVRSSAVSTRLTGPLTTANLQADIIPRFSQRRRRNSFECHKDIVDSGIHQNVTSRFADTKKAWSLSEPRLSVSSVGGNVVAPLKIVQHSSFIPIKPSCTTIVPIAAHPISKINGPTWDRTRDLPVMSRWLCQLSYGPARLSKERHLYYLPIFVFVKPCPPYRTVTEAVPNRSDNHYRATGFSAFDKVFQFSTAGRVTQLSQRFGFNLSNTLSCHGKILPPLLQAYGPPSHQSPKRIRSTFSSLGVNVARTLRVCSAKFRLTAASEGSINFLSSMKSPRWLSSSSPIGVSSEMGSRCNF